MLASVLRICVEGGDESRSNVLEYDQPGPYNVSTLLHLRAKLLGLAVDSCLLHLITLPLQDALARLQSTTNHNHLISNPDMSRFFSWTAFQ